MVAVSWATSYHVGYEEIVGLHQYVYARENRVGNPAVVCRNPWAHQSDCQGKLPENPWNTEEKSGVCNRGLKIAWAPEITQAQEIVGP